jgi:hypothetical protein
MQIIGIFRARKVGLRGCATGGLERANSGSTILFSALSVIPTRAATHYPPLDPTMACSISSASNHPKCSTARSNHTRSPSPTP